MTHADRPRYEGDRWAIVERRDNRLDGPASWIHFQNLEPKLFRSRESARLYVKERFGYLKSRPDLFAEPHGWRMPKVVRVTITVEILP